MSRAWNWKEKKIKFLRINNGGKYVYGDFLTFWKQKGITRPFIIPRTLQQNGVVEHIKNLFRLKQELC